MKWTICRIFVGMQSAEQTMHSLSTGRFKFLIEIQCTLELDFGEELSKMGVSCYRDAEKNFEMGLQSASTQVTTFYDNLSKLQRLQKQRCRGAGVHTVSCYWGSFFELGTVIGLNF